MRYLTISELPEPAAVQVIARLDRLNADKFPEPGGLDEYPVFYKFRRKPEVFGVAEFVAIGRTWYFDRLKIAETVKTADVYAGKSWRTVLD